MQLSPSTAVGGLVAKALLFARRGKASRYLILALGGVLGAVWYLLRFGWRSLVFTNIDWLIHDDWGQHVLGFLHFRLAPWGFPLGRIPTIVAPVGTNIGFTDSNPLLCLLLKPFSGVLPTDFQFIGPWLFLCFVLQGVAGALIGRLITSSRLGTVLVSAFFVISPVLENRVAHPTLSAHFMILFAFALHFVSDGSFLARRRFAVGTGLVWLASAVHPMMCVMVLSVVLALMAQHVVRGTLSKLGALWRLVLMVSVVIAVWRVIGLIGGDELHEAGGLGHYNSDLMTLVNPGDSSRLIPRLPLDGGAYEGVGYLGLGIILLGLLTPGLLAARGREVWLRMREHFFLILLCLVMMVLAFSTKWRIFGREVLDLEAAAKPLLPILEPFRSSGRFIWFIHYLLVITIMFASWRLLSVRRWMVGLVCLLLFAVQVMDMKRDSVDPRRPRDSWYHLNMPVLANLAQGRTKLELHPAMLWSNGPGCDMQDWEMNMIPQALYTAYKLRLPANTGYLARSSRRHDQSCRDQRSRVKDGHISKDTLYLVHSKHLEDLTRIPGVKCQESGESTSACVLN